MLLVRTRLAPSRIHGTGLFSEEFIPKGTPVWRLQEPFDQVLEPAALALLSEPAREQFLRYGYLDKDMRKYVLCFDDARFMNHSPEPSVVNGEGETCVAARDIAPGEEMTCDYSSFDGEYRHEEYLKAS